MLLKILIHNQLFSLYIYRYNPYVINNFRNNLKIIKATNF